MFSYEFFNLFCKGVCEERGNGDSPWARLPRCSKCGVLAHNVRLDFTNHSDWEVKQLSNQRCCRSCLRGEWLAMIAESRTTATRSVAVPAKARNDLREHRLPPLYLIRRR